MDHPDHTFELDTDVYYDLDQQYRLLLVTEDSDVTSEELHYIVFDTVVDQSKLTPELLDNINLRPEHWAVQYWCDAILQDHQAATHTLLKRPPTPRQPPYSPPKTCPYRPAPPDSTATSPSPSTTIPEHPNQHQG